MPRKNTKCSKCEKSFNTYYSYKNKSDLDKSKHIKIVFSDKDLHLLKNHNIIKITLYEKICKTDVNLLYDFGLFNTNSLHILDGVFEEGSQKKYIQQKKNVYNSKINRFSEHFGLLSFDENKVSKITILNDSRVDKEDPLIYQPKNTIETLKSDYIFHTHPKTPYLGSRLEHGIIYEFPSISDIIHFIDHHNNGKLIGSIVITPEGLYVIHKYYFNRGKIKVDTDILIDELYEVYSECYIESLEIYKPLKLKSMLKNGFIKIPDNIFFNKIADNFEFINKINETLIKFDLYIDFYPRIKLTDTKYWVIPDVYLPIL